MARPAGERRRELGVDPCGGVPHGRGWGRVVRLAGGGRRGRVGGAGRVGVGGGGRGGGAGGRGGGVDGRGWPGGGRRGRVRRRRGRVRLPGGRKIAVNPASGAIFRARAAFAAIIALRGAGDRGAEGACGRHGDYRRRGRERALRSAACVVDGNGRRGGRKIAVNPASGAIFRARAALAAIIALRGAGDRGAEGACGRPGDYRRRGRERALRSAACAVDGNGRRGGRRGWARPAGRAAGAGGRGRLGGRGGGAGG